MTNLPKSGRRCIAIRSDGTRCRSNVVNGLDEPLCAFHSGRTRPRGGGRILHGFYSKVDNDHFAYLFRVRPRDFVRQGGQLLEKEHGETR
jgi:hypothetical protein